MAYIPILTPEGALSIGGIVQHASMLMAIDRNDPAAFDALLVMLGGGNRISSHFRDDTFPPPWVLWRVGNDLVLSVDGTVNLGQGMQNVIGAFETPVPEFGVSAHSFFYQVWSSIRDVIVPVLPSDWRTCTWHFCGYSLGGAIAILGAHWMSRQIGSIHVDWLGIAAPKAFSGVPTTPQPGVMIGLAIQADVVPKLPPSLIAPLTIYIEQLAYMGIGQPWTHFGTWYRPTGSWPWQRADLSDFDAIPTPFELSAVMTNHLLDLYWSRFGFALDRAGVTGVPVTMRDFINGTIIPEPPIRVVPPQPVVPAVNFPEQNLQVFRQTPTVPLNPSNLHELEFLVSSEVAVVPASPIFSAQEGVNAMIKIVFMYKDDGSGQGWSEVWYRSGPFTSGVQQNNFAINYVTKRMKISGAETRFRRLRISTVGSRTPFVIYTDGDLQQFSVPITGQFVAPTGTDPGSDDSDSAFVVTKENPVSRGRMFMRGIPDCIFTGGGRFGFQGTFSADFNAWVTVCVAAGLGWLGAPAEIAQFPANILTVTQLADNRAQFTLNSAFPNTPGVETKYPVTIRGFELGRNLNGSLIVTSQGGTTCTSLRPLPIGNVQVTPITLMHCKTSIFQQVDEMSYSLEVGSRRSGRPFGQQAGRRKPARST